jgi:hypothetical protein
MALPSGYGVRPDRRRPEGNGGGSVHPSDAHPVATVVGMVAEGMTSVEITSDFPQLVRQALQFAAAAVDSATLPLPA